MYAHMKSVRTQHWRRRCRVISRFSVHRPGGTYGVDWDLSQPTFDRKVTSLNRPDFFWEKCEYWIVIVLLLSTWHWFLPKLLVPTSAAKPDPIFRVEPVFGMKKRVESGWVEPPGSKFGLDRVGLRFFHKDVLSGWTSLNPPTRINFQLQIFSYFLLLLCKGTNNKQKRRVRKKICTYFAKVKFVSSYISI